MKIYHFSGGREERERFFGESLADYIKESGALVPLPLSGEEIATEKEPHGKPYFRDPALEGIHFSKSHTKGHEILCFSDSKVGVDCENTEARTGIEDSYPGIAERCFTDEEMEYLRSEKNDPKRRFFEIWTAKEAYMKYTGNGFSEGFHTFSSLSAPGVRIETGRLDEAPHVVWSVCTASEGA